MKQRYQKLCSATLRTLDLQNTGKGWFSIKEKVTYRRDFFFYYFFTKNFTWFQVRKLITFYG